MKKKIIKVLKMELPGGDAHPGPKLASAGVNMAKFCTDFNAKTGDRRGTIVPVIITAYEDKSYDFVIKTTPAAPLILKAAASREPPIRQVRNRRPPPPITARRMPPSKPRSSLGPKPMS